ncbi:MAG: hypothetical protein IT495_08585 [Gammaproteobacteria bacterium]|nr:hypothetical protein [Gammaproteobacteria bacterium]
MESVYHREDGVYLIEIKLRELRQLFNSLDPAPFHEKDLDEDAEYYIVEALREIGLNRPAKLVVYLPASLIDSDDVRTLPIAMRNYFAYRADRARRDLRHVLGEGGIALAVGLAFLFACLTLRRLVGEAGSGILAEGLLIIGWVAMWRPLQIFLYDWWPIRRHRAILEAITRLPVEVRPRP